jgi:hypothetical protein
MWIVLAIVAVLAIVFVLFVIAHFPNDNAF